METLHQDKQIEIAVDLIDFCGGALSISDAHAFFKIRDYNLSDEQRNAIFLTALSLTKAIL